MDRRRYHGLDALRGVMMMLGIVLHAATFYLADPPVPIPVDRSTSVVFDVGLVFIHSFRMPVFFVLAGFFASLLVEKYGVAGSYANRAKRVLLPFLAGLVTIVPLTVWIILSFFLSVSTGERQLFTDQSQIELLNLDLEAMEEAGMREEPSPVHLWFLHYLLYFYLPLPLYGFLAARTAGASSPDVSRLLASPWTSIAFASITAITLWPFRFGVPFGGFLYFTPHPPSLLYYGTFFALGYLFHTHRSVLDTFQRCVTASGLLSLVLFPAALMASVWERQLSEPSLGVHALAVVLHAFCTWSLVYFFIGVSLRYFDFESPWIRFISQSSYWVYLVHMPIVGVFGWILLPYDLSAFVKFPIVMSATTVACFVSYQYLARTTWISVLLNGKRFSLDWPWRERRPGV